MVALYKKTLAGRKKKNTNPVIILFMVLFSFMCVYPFWYIMVLSFNDATDAFRGGIYFWPRRFSLANFATVFRNQYLTGSFMISVARVLIMAVAVPLIASLYAYALSQMELVGWKFFRWILIVPMYIGGGVIPFYILLRNLNLLNTFLVYIIPFLFGSFNVLLFRSYFSNLSASLRESAILDGANEIQVYFRIVVPISIPVFAAVSLFTGVGNWNDWSTGQLYVSDTRLYPIATILLQIIRSTNAGAVDGGANVVQQILENTTMRVTTESVRYAMIVVATVPILLIYPLLQKYFIHGIMIGAVKE